MLARGLGPIGRGEFAIALAVFSLAATLGSFGQAERLSADLRDDVAINSRPRYFIVGCISAVAAIAAWVSVQTLGANISTANAVAVAVPIVSFGLLWRAVAVSQGKSLVLATQAAAPAIVRFLLITLIFATGGLSTFSATATTTLCTSLGVLYLWLTLRSARPQPPASAGALKPRAFFADVKTGVLQGLPVLGFALCTAVSLRADVFLLNALSTPEQVGYYAATVAITESALAVSAAFKNRMQSAAYTDDPIPSVRRELLVMLAIVLPIAALGEAIAHPFTVAMFGVPFAPAVPALRVLIVAAIALMLVDSGQGLLAVLGRRREMFITSAIGAIVTLLALGLLVPHLGAVGAGIASLIAYSTVGVASWFIAVRALRSERQVSNE
ncbi:polysaccharide biosynthesis C-terminal domain-containing protein [Mycolicibacterium frederiksbergense]|uniref:polysaccharide biosynthesis C-terminal domain-containing protein n=1 Tax=Mycolicibacterium frederiksbergense TaxID=117567 RepID=UPI00265B85D6|nr:polysaccharide biosynthesis C-terminal domain-containing protein [Mycolicibacterium frederiksbergense]MDO0972829.1 polysaccharide biosynthesis C-terminal domain-containing protein [Mycolicibacterium frederiksbergense]